MKLKVTHLVFLFWFIFVAKESFTYLFFQSNPKVGTLFQAVSELAIGFLFVLILLHNRRIPDLTKNFSILVWLIVLLSVYQGISLLWADSSSFFASFSYWFISFTEVLLVLSFSKILDPNLFLEKSFKGFTHGTLFLSFVALSAGQTLDGRLGDNSFLHPNVIGNMFALAAISSLYLILTSKNRKYYSLLFLYFIGILFTVLSKTAIVSLILALSIFVVLGKIKKRYKILSLLAFSSLIFILFDKIYGYWESYAQVSNGEALLTFTGRTIIWEKTLILISENPIFGYGFFSFRDKGPQPFPIEINTAHNEFLNLWFCFGAIGLAFSIMIYLLFFISSIKSKDKILGTISLVFFIYFMSRGISEGNKTGLLFLTPILLMLSTSIQIKSKQKVLALKNKKTQIIKEA